MSEGAIPDAALNAPARGPADCARTSRRRRLAPRSLILRTVWSLLLLFGLACLGTAAMTQGASAHEGHFRVPSSAQQAARAKSDADRDCDDDCCKTSLFRGCCGHGLQSGLTNAAGLAVMPEFSALAFPPLPRLPHDSRSTAPEPAPPRLAAA